MCKVIRRCEIWEANLHKTEGSVQYGRRPVLVIQSDVGNNASTTVTVVPLTRATKANIITHEEICACREHGLMNSSTALMEGITTISVTQFIRRRGKINENLMKRIEDKLLIQLGMRGACNAS